MGYSDEDNRSRGAGGVRGTSRFLLRVPEHEGYCQHSSGCEGIVHTRRHVHAHLHTDTRTHTREHVERTTADP